MWKEKQKRLCGNADMGLQRQADGHKSFRNSQWSVSAAVGAPAFKAEERRIAELWNNLPDEEKQPWHGSASASSAAQQACNNNLTMETINAHAGSMSHGTVLSLKRKSAEVAMKSMQQHSLWSSGLYVGNFLSALAPAWVALEPTQQDCAKEVADIFNYDPRVIVNPQRVKTDIRLPCGIAYWGLCIKDIVRMMCKHGAVNAYYMLKARHIDRTVFPVIIELQIGACVQFHLLTDTIGKGATLLLLELVGSNDVHHGDIFEVAWQPTPASLAPKGFENYP